MEVRSELKGMEMIFISFFVLCQPEFLIGYFSAVGAGGAALTLISVVLVCAFWLLPQALMAAELSLLMDVNGGTVWVQRAFGDYLSIPWSEFVCVFG